MTKINFCLSNKNILLKIAQSGIIYGVEQEKQCRIQWDDCPRHKIPKKFPSFLHVFPLCFMPNLNVGLVLAVMVCVPSMANEAECENCYKCTLYEGGNCVECSYDEAYCNDSDEEWEGSSDYCTTILELNNRCVRQIYVPRQDTISSLGDIFVDCSGDGTPYYGDDSLFSLCETDTCAAVLGNNWESFMDALCYTSSAAEMADYFGIVCAGADYAQVDCEVCDSGYYYNGLSCEQCPGLDGATANTTVGGYQQGISTCYMPTETQLTDAFGAYEFTQRCGYYGKLD